MRNRLLVTGDGYAHTYELPERGAVVVGRSTDAQVCIPHASISRRHLRIVVGDHLSVEDLGSSNGTRIDGARLVAGRPVSVAPGEPVRFGQLVAVIQRDARAVAESLERTAPGDITVMLQPEKGLVIGKSEGIRRLYELIDRVAPGLISVLILGETGVGKQVVAQALHDRSRRARGPFLSLSCVSIPETLLEGELLGYEKGAFTGATQAKPGLFESASGGTVFLDEIGEIPASIQAKLLRVLEDRQVLRLGATKARPLDVRFITATNRDLEAEVRAGRFRQDLFFRLNGITLRVPPLRERLDELEGLTAYFLRVVCTQLDCTEPPLSQAAVERMRAHAWPGNVRELRNVIERSVLLCGDGSIEPEHLELGAPHGRPAPADSGAREQPTEPMLRGAMAQQARSPEHAEVLAALEACHGNQTRAAKLLGISRSAFVARLDRFAIPRPRKAPDEKA